MPRSHKYCLVFDVGSLRHCAARITAAWGPQSSRILTDIRTNQNRVAAGEIPLSMYATAVTERRGTVQDYVAAYIQRIIRRTDSPDTIYRVPNDREELDALQAFLANPGL